MHDYRVMVKGRFAGLSDEQKAKLLAELKDHDFADMGFTAKGGFTYYEDLGPFTFRYEITVDDEEGEKEAVEQALDKAKARLGEYGHGKLTVSSTDMRDIKIRRR